MSFNLKIIEISDERGFSPYAASFPTLALFYGKQQLGTPGGKLLVAVNADTGSPYGLAVIGYSEERDGIGICYIYTNPLFRREGVASALLEKILSEGLFTAARFTLTDNDKAFDFLMKKFNFNAVHISTLYRIRCDKDSSAEFFASIRKIGDRLMRAGYKAAAFSDCAPALLTALERRINAGDFPQQFNPFVDAIKCDYRASFIGYRDDTPVAFMANFLQNDGRNIQLKYIASANDCHGKGVVALPIYALNDYQISTDWRAADIRGVVSVTNDSMNNMLDNRYLRGQVTKRGEIIKYYTRHGD
jgi:GNAT superfamily N-acetyltransferase